MPAPSPHRFLAPAASARKPKPKPQSNLRYGISAQTPAPKTRGDGFLDEEEAPKVTPAKRFVIPSPRPPAAKAPHTPRERIEEPMDQWTDTPPISRVKASRTLKRVDSIDESSPSSSANATEHGVAQSIEQHHASSTSDPRLQEDEESEEEILFITEAQNKRRRISPTPPPPPSSPPVYHAPATPAPAAHRFKAPAPKTTPSYTSFSHHHIPPSATATPGPPPHRPHFILPPQPSSPNKPATPHPETFSPSRKKERYIPGGLAATLHTWTVETYQNGYAAQSANVPWARDSEDGVRMRVRVMEVGDGKPGEADEVDGGMQVEAFAGGVVFVRGVTDVGAYNASRMVGVEGYEEQASGEMRLMLSGKGSAREKNSIKVREGDVVGVRAPFWDVDLGDGGVYTVAVDWSVLS